VSFENISPDEWEEAKIEAAKRKVVELEREMGKDERSIEIAKKLLKRNLSNEDIAEDTGLSLEQIETLRNEENS
ncbi:MAG: hypothetical protein KA783_07640, partial [Chitinophagales bacterium]|nr:hypothetical protein [Chitinophagales bacterium]